MRAREQITALISSLTCPTAFRFPIENHRDMIVFFRMVTFFFLRVKHILYVVYIVEHFIQPSVAIWKSHYIRVYVFLFHFNLSLLDLPRIELYLYHFI